MASVLLGTVAGGIAAPAIAAHFFSAGNIPEAQRKLKTATTAGGAVAGGTLAYAWNRRSILWAAGAIVAGGIVGLIVAGESPTKFFSIFTAFRGIDWSRALGFDR